jgi:hypothetical protein
MNTKAAKKVKSSSAAKTRTDSGTFLFQYIGRGYEVRMLAAPARDKLRSFRLADTERLVGDMMRGTSVTIGTGNGLVVIKRCTE